MSSLVNLVLLHLEHNKLTKLGEFIRTFKHLEDLVGDIQTYFLYVLHVASHRMYPIIKYLRYQRPLDV